MESRLDIQDRVRRLKKEPREEEVKKIELLRQSLMAEISILNRLQNQVRVTTGVLHPFPDDPVPALFDNLDDGEDNGDIPTQEIENGPSLPSTSGLEINDESASSMITPELTKFHLPSTSSLPADHPHCIIELKLRQRQAALYLNALREAIAEKSFQYSHVIRIAPRKSIRSRARSHLVLVNNEISLLSRAYNRCHTAMIRLEASARTLSTYQPLSKEDVKSSTALLDPNTPGSTELRLSWIWQMSGAGDHQTPEALRECSC